MLVSLTGRLSQCGLIAVLLAAASGRFTAACKSESQGKPAATRAPVVAPKTEPVEIFTWWTAPGEREAFRAFTQVLKGKFANVEVVDLAQVSGSGQTAHKRLRRRIAEGRPPDGFHVYPLLLAELVNPEDPKVEALDALYNMKHWNAIFPASAIKTVTHNGHRYAVPLGMHRRNTLFANPALVSTPPTSLEGFFKKAAKLRKRGIPAIAVGTGGGDWPLLVLFNAVLAGSAGIDFFEAFYNGAVDVDQVTNRRHIEKAVSDFSRVLGYANKNGAALRWDQAAQLLIDGKAAMFIHGNWAEGYYSARGWTPLVAPAPGTDGLFAFNVDAFAVCKNAPHPENARRFINAVGSVEGQAAFNRLKGSLPVRKDVSVKGWGGTFEATHDAFVKARTRVNMDQFLFDGLDAVLGGLYRKDRTAEAVSRWIIENYETALFPYDSPRGRLLEK